MISKDKITLGMLIFVPIAITTSYLELSPVIVFVVSGLAIIPLSALIANSTENIADVIGPTLGGLVNATFGNMTELVVAIVALRAGLVKVVQASLLGSIIANLLLALGLSMLIGGLKFKEQEFQVKVADLNASSLLLAILVLLTPRAIDLTSPSIPDNVIQNFSYAASILLLIFYVFSLVFTFTNSREPKAAHLEAAHSESVNERSISPNLSQPIIKLLIGTLVLVFVSEILVGSLESTVETLGLTPLFTGVILLPLFGGIVEYITCVTAASKNKMDLAVAVATGSTLQIVLFVTPVLVLLGVALGQDLTLEFNAFGIFAAVSSVLITNSISADGRSNWLEGVLLLILYGVLGVAFFLHP
jgi:Ca2+:H+ antiporter